MTAVQTGLTSITVTWTASSDATGYRIHYTSDSDSGSETVSDRETVSHTLTGLVNGESYVISVAATSDQLSSVAVAADATVSVSKLYISTLDKKTFTVGLMRGATYNISIMANSSTLPSDVNAGPNQTIGIHNVLFCLTVSIVNGFKQQVFYFQLKLCEFCCYSF